jgi:hypothetical protein
MKEWQKELTEELEPGLVAHSEDGRETHVDLDFDAKDGSLRLEWKVTDDGQWHLTIPHATLMAVVNAMAKRLYPSTRHRRRG